MATKPFSLPTKLRVGYRTYTVVPMSSRDLERLDQYGECNKIVGEMLVCNEQDPLVVLDTLLHETFHAVWHEYNLADKVEEEPTVHMLATGLTQVLYDNEELVKVCTHLLRIAKQQGN